MDSYQEVLNQLGSKAKTKIGKRGKTKKNRKWKKKLERDQLENGEFLDARIKVG